jgi:hypothetical protein
MSRVFEIWQSAGLTSAGPTVQRGAIPEQRLPAGDGTLTVRGVRAAPDAAPGLAAHDGLLIRLILDAGATR